MHHRRRAVVPALLLCALLSLSSLAAIPGADNPNAPTQHDFLRQQLDYARRTIPEAYKALGHRDPKWDEPALKFLDAMARYVVYSPMRGVYRPNDLPARDDLIAQGKSLADAGCTDPMVAFCRGVLLHSGGKRADAEPLLAAAIKGLAARKYAPVYLMQAAQRQANLLEARRTPPRPNAAADAATARTVARDACTAALFRKVDDRDLRVVVDLCTSEFNYAPVDQQRDICQLLERNPDVSRWTVNFLYGRHHIKAGWDARGSGYAFTVTEDGWKGFYDHFTKARDYLVKAHALHPDYPDAATSMITVAMGAGDRLKESMRDWFDKAVRAQFDYRPAYEAYEFGLFPRWHGTHRKMFEFGVECAATKRYDTDVPYELMQIIRRISDDENDGDMTALDAIAIPEVYAAIDQLFTELVEKFPDPDARDWYATEHLALAWKARHFDTAAKLLDKYADRLKPKAFENLLAWRQGAISQIRLMTSPHAELADAADRAADNKDYAAALTQYKAVVDKLPADHPGRLYARFRAKAVEIQKALAAGEDWVTLTNEPDFAPWTAVTGDFKFTKDGAIEATANENGRAVLLCRVDLGPAYEIRATVDTIKGRKVGIPAIYAQWYASNGFGVGMVAPWLKSAYAQGAKGLVQKPAPPAKFPLTLGVRVDGKRFTTTVNDKPVVDCELNPRTPNHDAFAGIGVRTTVPNGVVRFTNIQVRRIPLTPAPPAP